MFAATSTLSEVEEYMASLYKAGQEETKNGFQSSSSSSDSDEVEIVKELKVSLKEHGCDLCTKGAFLVDKLLKFGGVMNKYHCEVCFKSFKTKSQALKHAKVHKVTKELKTPEPMIETNASRSKPLTCSLCLFQTWSETGMKRHTTNQHKMPHTCGKCGVTFKSMKKFQEHCASRCSMQIKIKNCRACNKSFVFEKSFKEHVCSIELE